jgi:hypothetical protein
MRATKALGTMVAVAGIWGGAVLVAGPAEADTAWTCRGSTIGLSNGVLCARIVGAQSLLDVQYRKFGGSPVTARFHIWTVWNEHLYDHGAFRISAGETRSFVFDVRSAVVRTVCLNANGQNFCMTWN